MKKMLLIFFFFFLPFQTQWIFRVGQLSGQPWEYGTIGVYATDVLLVAIFLLSFWGGHADARIGSPSLPAGRQTRYRLAGMTAYLVLFFSVVVASDRLVASIHVLWLIEAGVIAWIVAKTPQEGGNIIDSFITGSVLQALIGLWQFLTQSTVASTLLGWAAHPAWQPGTSVIEVEGERWLRAYAGLPHPNIFGGWMAIALLIMFHEYSLSLSKGRRRRLLFFCSLVLLSAGLAVSFSRSAWLAAAVGIVILLLSFWRAHGEAGIRSDSGQARMTIAAFTVLFSVSAILFPYRSLLATRLQTIARLEQQSLTERARGYQDAIVLIKQHPLLGVGIGNFTAAVAFQNSDRPVWSIQPVHNVFLLMLAEIGVLGAILMLLFFIQQSSLRRSPWRLWQSLLPIFFILALSDHYLWSLHAGLLLSGILIGLILTTGTPSAKMSGTTQSIELREGGHLKTNGKKAITLIGMSNAGKSHWSQKIAQETGRQRICCDDEIEKALEPELQAQGLAGISDVARWMGLPFEERSSVNQQRYLNIETMVMRDIIERLMRGADLIIDTTGSVIHCPKEIGELLGQLTTVVLLDTPESAQQAMIEAFIANLKPVIWGEHFSFEATATGVPEEPMDAVRRCYPKLLAARNQLYRQMAHVLIPRDLAQDPELTVAGFLDMVDYNRL